MIWEQPQSYIKVLGKFSERWRHSARNVGGSILPVTGLNENFFSGKYEKVGTKPLFFSLENLHSEI